jgi:hypothetical protein
MGSGDSNRQYISPPLESGRRYTYDVKARWMGQDGREMTSTRSFEFQGGQTDLNFDLFQGAQPASTQQQGTGQYQSSYPQNVPSQNVPPTPDQSREQLPAAPQSTDQIRIPNTNFPR